VKVLHRLGKLNGGGGCSHIDYRFYYEFLMWCFKKTKSKTPFTSKINKLIKNLKAFKYKIELAD